MYELCGRIDQLSPAEAAAQILVSPLALETARLESQDQQFFFSASDTNRSGCQPSAQVGRPDHQYRPGGQLQQLSIFHIRFQKYYGCTPSQYRADSRKEKE